MLVYKWWETKKDTYIYRITKYWEGWFLFGFLPLYVRRVREEQRPK